MRCLVGAGQDPSAPLAQSPLNSDLPLAPLTARLPPQSPAHTSGPRVAWGCTSQAVGRGPRSWWPRIGVGAFSSWTSSLSFPWNLLKMQILKPNLPLPLHPALLIQNLWAGRGAQPSVF